MNGLHFKNIFKFNYLYLFSTKKIFKKVLSEKITFNLILILFPIQIFSQNCPRTIINNDSVICGSATIELKSTQFIYDTLLIDQFTVSVTGSFSHTTPVITGQKYFFNISGTMSFYSGNSHLNDEFYDLLNWDSWWVCHFNNGGNITSPTPIYNITHIYNVPFTAVNTNITFSFSDSNYGDNSGSFYIKVYQLVPRLIDNYLWSTGETSNSISVFPSSSTKYFLTSTSGSYSCKDSVAVTVNPLPTVTSGGGTILCNGSSINITASGANTYTWSNGLGTGTSKTVNPSTTTTYIVTGTDSKMCSNTAQSVVIVSENLLPTSYNLNSSSSDYCLNSGGITLTLAGSQTGVNYQLLKNGTNDGIVVAGSGSILNWTGKLYGTYTVTAINTTTGCFNDMSGIAVITENPLPIITASGETICNGSTATIRARSSSIILEVLVVGGGGCGMGGGGGGGLLHDTTYAVSQGQGISVIVGNGGKNIVRYVWTSGENSSFGTMNAIGGGKGGWLSVSLPETGGSGGGGDNSQSRALGTSGQGYAGGNGSTTGNGCGGGGGAGGAGSNGSSDKGGKGGVGLTLSITGSSVGYAGGGGGGGSASVGSATHGGGTGGTYVPTKGTVNTGGGGGGNWWTYGADGGSGIVIVSYQAESLLPGTGGVITTYTKNGITYYVHTFTSSGTFTAPSISTTYSWSNGLGDGLSKTVNPSISTTYTVTGTDNNGCTASSNAIVTVNPLIVPIVSAGITGLSCNSTILTLGGVPTASSGTLPYTYAWVASSGTKPTAVANPTSAPTITTTYTVTVMDSKGCTATSNVVRTVNPLPTASAGSVGQCCSGTTVTMGGSPTASSGTSPYTYIWGASSGSAPTAVANPTSAPTINTTYTVTVTDFNGCISTNTVIVNLTPLWTSMNSGTTNQLNSIYFTNSNTGYIVGFFGTILKTSDAGNTWTTLPSGTTNHLRYVVFTDVNTGYVVGNSGTILKTINGGTSWTALTSGITDWFYSVFFTDANTGYAVGAYGNIVKTIDGGTTWNSLPSGTSNHFLSVYFTDANTGYAVGYAGTIVKTINGGTSWNALSSGSTDNLSTVYFTDANTGYMADGKGNIFKTTNAGDTWTSQSGGTGDNLMDFDFIDLNRGFVMGYSGAILRTTNAGSTWTILPSGTTNDLRSVCFTDANNGYAVGTNGTIIKTTSCFGANLNSLPIQLLYFKSICTNNKIKLCWATSTETNNDYFTIEVSSNGSNFTELKHIKGAGNSKDQQNYSEEIYFETDNLMYFRLKQTDYNGAFTYSPIISIDENCMKFHQELFYLLSPNPTESDNLRLTVISSIDQKISITCYNMIGQKMYNKIIPVHKNQNIILPLLHLSSGLYLIVISTTYKKYVEKIIIN